MTITSPLKKSIRAVLNSLTRLKTAEIVYTDRFSGKRKSVIADQLIFNNNDYLAYVNSIDYYLPFNRIEEIKSDDSLLWSRKVFEKENKLKVINQMIDGLKKHGRFTAWFDFFRKNDRFLGMITVGSFEDEFWVTVEECDEEDIHADDLFTRDERHTFKTAEEALDFALRQNSEVSAFDFYNGGHGFMADAAKSLLLFVLRKERKDEERLRKKRFDEMEEEYARKNKIEAKLTSEELELREKILIAWIRFYDGPGSHNDPKTCPPERRKGLIETLNIMKEIDLKADLKKMRNLLTPKEYKRFLPIYNYFKKTGKFSIPGFRGE